MNFIHMADMHLGYRQYDLEQRFVDLGRTFKQIVEYAIAQKVEFVLISGDLFDKRSINAPTYVQAVHVLSMLKSAGITCIVIEGNHDRRFIKDGMSWLESLEWEGLLKVIKNLEGDLMGGHVDVGRTRIYGYGFGGSMTANAIPIIAREIRELNARDKPDYTILLMHAGVEGQARGGIIGEVTYEDLYQLKDEVDYLALGHYHNAYEIDGWVYNPGCPDTCSIAEVGSPKGFYHVIDCKPRLIPVDTRRFFVLRESLDGHKSVETLLADVEQRLAGLNHAEGSIIHLILEGTLNFDKSRVDLESMSERARELTGALYVDIRFDLLNDEFSVGNLDTEGLNRAAIELEVFRKIGRSDSMTADKCDLFAGAMAEIKDLAAKGADESTLDAVMRKAFEALDMPTAIIEESIVVKPRAIRKKRQAAGGQTLFDTEGGP